MNYGLENLVARIRGILDLLPAWLLSDVGPVSSLSTSCSYPSLLVSPVQNGSEDSLAAPKSPLRWLRRNPVSSLRVGAAVWGEADLGHSLQSLHVLVGLVVVVVVNPSRHGLFPAFRWVDWEQDSSQRGNQASFDE